MLRIQIKSALLICTRLTYNVDSRFYGRKKVQIKILFKAIRFPFHRVQRNYGKTMGMG